MSSRLELLLTLCNISWLVILSIRMVLRILLKHKTQIFYSVFVLFCCLVSRFCFRTGKKIKSTVLTSYVLTHNVMLLYVKSFLFVIYPFIHLICFIYPGPCIFRFRVILRPGMWIPLPLVQSRSHEDHVYSSLELLSLVLLTEKSSVDFF